ncbi:MAG: DUF1553 domain-containing protein [Planctomycetales bacterium]|nr:DUF1553 domain-containing protein [Planctomycetales bacterium]
MAPPPLDAYLEGTRVSRTKTLSSVDRCWQFLVIAYTLLASTNGNAAEFRVEPAEISLVGNFSRGQVCVRELAVESEATERANDLTAEAKFTSSDANIFTVDATGMLVAVGDGTASLRVTVGDKSHDVPVTVSGVVENPSIDFDRQVAPILSKLGCNMGACHASQHGKGGFKLSVFGFEPGDDHAAIVRDRLGRRVELLDPEQSLFLQKPTMQVAHGGGLRLKADSVDYQILKAWLADQAPGPMNDAAKVIKLTVTPAQRIGSKGLTQQLRVVAAYSDETTRDVTAWALFDSMDEGVLAVTSQGSVRAVGQGQASIMVRFDSHAEIVNFVIPYKDSVELAGWKNNNFIDELAEKKFRELGIEPSPLCDDATFVRRVYVDVIGTLPTVAETTNFIESSDPDKRDKLIDRLLGLTGDPNLDIYNEPYSAYWTLKWSDLIRNTSNKLGDQGMWALHNWIRDSFRANKPIDRFVRELVTGTGSIYSNGPANYFRINASSTDLTESTSQLFLGIRLECAKCHHHPFENISQGDYYGFSAFFARVGTKNSEEFGLFGREQVVVVRESGEVRHPKTGKNLPPTPLGAEPIDHPLDRRIALADWLAAPDNEYFARSIVNRYMYYLLGRGLVDPVDDLRSTNPPTNIAMMNALSQQLVESGFDLKQLIRSIVSSRLYQLDSQPTHENAADNRFYSHFKVKRLPAEALLDAIDQVTGVQTKFKSLPLGTRAIELPDAEYPNYFLNTFAKPRRASVCECERSPDESLSQALHTLNGDTLANKIADKNGRLMKLIAGKTEHQAIVAELYLATLSRFPTEQEQAAAREFLADYTTPQECYEDLIWALMNSKQFLFVQ